jgi:hypothetical protein
MIAAPTSDWLDGYSAVVDAHHRQQVAHALALQMHRRGNCREAEVREAYSCVQDAAEAIRDFVERNPR